MVRQCQLMWMALDGVQVRLCDQKSQPLSVKLDEGRSRRRRWKRASTRGQSQAAEGIRQLRFAFWFFFFHCLALRLTSLVDYIWADFTLPQFSPAVGTSETLLCFLSDLT